MSHGKYANGPLQFEGAGQRPHRQEDAHGHDRERHGHQPRRGAALDERQLRRADHVHDQRLRQHAGDEPAPRRCPAVRVSGRGDNGCR